VKSDSTVEVRAVKTEGDGGDFTVVQTGLKEGESVVTSNQYRLQAGAHVRAGDSAVAGGPAGRKATTLARASQ
jgi:hypothetical protein